MTGLIIGGDLRQFYLAERLEFYGFNILTYQIQTPNKVSDSELTDIPSEEADFYVLPVPITIDGKYIKMEKGKKRLLLEEFELKLHKSSIVFGGMFPLELKKRLSSRGIEWIDLMDQQCIAVKNAIATAEGAISEAIQEGKGNLHRSRCLVLGYGRCAKVLASKLSGLSAYVSVSCRSKEALCMAESMGYEVFPIDMLRSRIGEYQYVFNTIPAQILTSAKLCKCMKDVVIIDIASKPGGTDLSYCTEQNICAKLCGSLPGIYAPKASGEILSDEIAEILNCKCREITK